MEKGGVLLELVNGKEKEYIVKDRTGITIGRVFITELDKDNRYCCFKLNFYRYSGEAYDNLKNILKLMLMSLFKNMNMYKINVLINEEIDLRPFMDLGFKLEGIIEDSIEVKGERFSKLIFGIDYRSYESNIRRIPLKLKGEKIELKVLTPEDAEDVLDYYIRNREHLMPFEPSRDESFYSLQYQKRSLIESYKNYLNGIEIEFGVYEEQKFIGIIKVSNIIYGVFKNAFVGYSMDEKHQGKGYMKDALRLVVNYCFEEMGLHRLEASTLVDNEKSQSVLKACGFKELGLNENYLFINGKWRDHISFYNVRK
nr:GNAT family protein [Haloimpatiens lingqiaonensis]